MSRMPKNLQSFLKDLIGTPLTAFNKILAADNQNSVDLVGMGFMTRMAQKAYRMAAAIRAFL